MKKPQLFILGAPKCGTTSVARWLAQHPEVYMAPTKEPHHFYSPYGRPMALAEYERLFADAGPQHSVVGEASVWYLFSGTAVPAILEYAPQARFIVCLRNPVAAALSLHAQKVETGHEAFTSFERAWAASPARAAGAAEGILALPRGNPAHMAYGEACRFGSQLELLFHQVPRSRVFVVLLDELAKNPEYVWAALEDFLGVTHHRLESFQAHNSSTVPRSAVIQKFLLRATLVRDALGLRAGSGLLAPLRRLNTKTERYAQPPAELHQLVSQHYADEIAKVETLLGRSLPGWHPED